MAAANAGTVVTTDLVERAQRGDHEAFDRLATAAYDRLYAIAHRILRDRYSAEDAVQEALMAAWRNLRSLRDVERFDAWLHRLLVRACHDELQRSKRRANVRPIDLDIDRPATTDDIATLVEQEEIERAFLSLSVDHRAVLVLTHYVGLPAPQVAGILGIPVGTVYSRLHYGLRAMRDVLVPSQLAVASPGHG